MPISDQEVRDLTAVGHGLREGEPVSLGSVNWADAAFLALRSFGTHEAAFMRDRAGRYSQAIGLARLVLNNDGPLRWDRALDYLDDAVAVTHEQHWAACLADGATEEAVERFLGPRGTPPPPVDFQAFLNGLREACEYAEDPEEVDYEVDDSVDALIEYKNALEDALGRVVAEGTGWMRPEPPEAQG